MDGNTIYQDEPITAFSNPSYSGNNLPLQEITEESASESFFSGGLISKIVKILIGFIVVFIFIFIVVNFILPLLTKNNTKEIVTLSYWGLWEDKNIFAPIISDFERKNPNIKIDFTKEDPKQYRERLITRINNGTGPDIFRFHNSWLPEVKTILLPLPQEAISKDEFQKNYYPVSVKDLTQNGAIYGIPLGVDTIALFTNTEILKAAGVAVPKTWNDFSSAAKQLTVKDESGKIKTAGAAMGTYDNITHAPDIISLLLVQNGAKLENLLDTKQNSKDALDYYVSFANGGGNVWDNTLNPSILAFSNGTLAMYFGFSWDILTIKALNPNLSFEVHSVPSLPGRNQTIASYWIEGVSAKSKHKKEAFMFMNFLSQKETEQKLFTEESKTRLIGEPYARVDLAQTLKDNPMVYPFLENAKIAESSFFASDTFDNGLNSKLNSYLGNAIRSMLGNTSSDTALETLTKGVNQVLTEYGKL